MSEINSPQDGSSELSVFWSTASRIQNIFSKDHKKSSLKISSQSIKSCWRLAITNKQTIRQHCYYFIARIDSEVVFYSNGAQVLIEYMELAKIINGYTYKYHKEVILIYELNPFGA